MRITIVTPLFPPDASTSAKYVKGLASRLKEKHDVTVVHFGRLPERVSTVNFISIPKRLSILTRLWKMFVALYSEFKKTDLILLQNGPSVELPATLASLLSQKKFVCVMSDTAAHSKPKQGFVKKIIARALSYRCITCVVFDSIEELLPPIFHPLKAPNPKSTSIYNEAWDKHLEKLLSTHTL